MKTKSQIISVLVLIFSAMYFNLSAKSGDLDSSFGENGISLLNNGSDYSFHCSALDGDGNIITAGRFSNLKEQIMIQRFHPNGSIDSSFGINGSGKVDFDEKLYATCKNIIITTDNKIVVLGTLTSNKTNLNSLFVLTFNQKGLHDTKFSDNGLFLLAENDKDLLPKKIIEYHDNNGYLILTSRKDILTGKYQSLIIKLNEDGNIDSTFQNNGQYTINQLPGLTILDLIHFNDKYLLGGYKKNEVDNTYVPILLRFIETFEPDYSFGIDGLVANDVGANLIIRFVRSNTDGTIISAGHFVNSLGTLYLSKYSEKGILDKNFGINGFSKTSFQGWDEIKSLNIDQNNERILISGYSILDDNVSLFIQMFTKYGIPDSSFGTDSKIMIRYSTVNTTYGFTHLQKDNKIILIGEVYYPINSIVLYRYLTDFDVGINEALDDYNTFIFPNPVNNFVYISYELKSPDYIKFELYNYIGDKVRDLNQPEFRESGYHNEMINLGDNLEDGLYLLKFSSSIYTRIFKIQVSK